jgi:hypothetical protein
MIRIDWLRGAVPGAGLGRLDARVRDELHAGLHDPRDVGCHHDRAVHLRQLAQPGRGEVDVEVEAAGAQRVHELVVAEDDEGAGVAAQDALEAVPQLRAGSDLCQRHAQQVVSGRHFAPRAGVVRSLRTYGATATFRSDHLFVTA